MPRIPNSPHNSGCGPMHTHTSASENIKLQMMMAKLEDSLKNEFVLKDQLKTINSELLIGSGNIDITCIDRIEKTASEGLVDTYTIYFNNAEPYSFIITNGEKGDKGDKGDQGPQGDDGADGLGISSIEITESGDLVVRYTDSTEVNLGKVVGEKGDTGSTGTTGKSAFELAQANGYTGTLQEWLVSLKGDQGEQGPEGPKGPQGERGTGIYLKSKEEDCKIAGDAYIINDSESENYGHIFILVDTESRKFEDGGEIKGPKGDKGDRGDIGPEGSPGKAFTYEDFTEEQLAALKGPQGDKGDAFTYDDFTAEQLTALKGPQGEKGDKGDKGEKGDKGDKGDRGDAFTYEDFTTAQLEALRGPQGERGLQGLKGDQGPIGPTGPQGATGPQGPKGDKGDTGISIIGVSYIPPGKGGTTGLVDTYAVHFSNGDANTFTVTNGAKGEPGPGIKEIQVVDENVIEDGKSYSKYCIIFENNSIPNFMFKLPHGGQGPQGEVGPVGPKGENGKSAYQSWLDAGYTGTELEFATWLKGEKGETGEKGADGYTPVKGVDYFDGKDGINGQNGKDGISPILRIIENIWEVSYDNGVTYVSTGINAVGPAGKDGIDGKDGAQGPTGQNGADGVGIADIKHDRNDINGNCVYVITLTDGRTEEFTVYKGADGAQGLPGENGKDGLTTAVKVGDITYVHENGIVTLPNFTTPEYVTAEIAKAKLEGEDVDLSGFATKEDVRVSIAELVDSAPATLNTLGELAEAINKHEDAYNALLETVGNKAAKEHTHEEYLTEHQSLENYYTKTEVDAKIPSLDGYAKTEDIPIDYLKESDLEGYSKFSGSYNDLTDKPEIPSVDGLASEDFVRTEIGKIELPKTDLTNYYTKEEVDNLIENVDVDLSDYALKSELITDYNDLENKPVIPDAYDDTEIRDLISEKADNDHNHDSVYIKEHQNIDHLATKAELEAYVTETELTTKGYLTSQDVSEKADKTELIGLATQTWVQEELAKIDPTIPSEYITETELEAKGYITTDALVDKADRSELNSLATKQELQDAIDGINIPETDLSNYYNKSETENLIAEAVQDIEHPTVDLDGYATEDWVQDQGYLTEHQDLSDYALKSEIPVVSDFVTENQVAETLDDYYDKQETAVALNAKADDIPFTEDLYVTNALGLFTIGESIKGLSIREILAKLLGLSDVPVEPEEPTSIIETIMSNETPMLAVTADGQVTEIPYKLIRMTETEALEQPTESGFFQIVDANGTQIKAGYQELQADSEDVYYVIALPKEIDYPTMVTMELYSTALGKWMEAENFKFTKEPAEVAALCDEAGLDISHIDTDIYTVWAVDECPTGSKLRFIINE